MLLAAVLSGCNTMAGVGRDVEAGGNAIERSATRNR
jgi:predicted small secreted protein